MLCSPSSTSPARCRTDDRFYDACLRRSRARMRTRSATPAQAHERPASPARQCFVEKNSATSAASAPCSPSSTATKNSTSAGVGVASWSGCQLVDILLMSLVQCLGTCQANSAPLIAVQHWPALSGRFCDRNNVSEQKPVRRQAGLLTTSNETRIRLEHQMANVSRRAQLRWGLIGSLLGIVAVASVAVMPDESRAEQRLSSAATVQLAQAQPGAPGGAQPPGQPNGAPANPQGEAEGGDHQGQGCRYREKDDLQLLV